MNVSITKPDNSDMAITIIHDYNVLKASEIQSRYRMLAQGKMCNIITWTHLSRGSRACTKGVSSARVR